MRSSILALAAVLGASAAKLKGHMGGQSPLPSTGQAHKNDTIPAISPLHPANYIVVYKYGTPKLKRSEHARAMHAAARQVPGSKGHKSNFEIHRFAGAIVHMDFWTAESVRKDPHVAIVAEDAVVWPYMATHVQHRGVMVDTDVPWGLSRISHRQRGERTYEFNLPSSRVYVVDTGVRCTHIEFQGPQGPRCEAGKSFVKGSSPGDGNGHGTHVAATIAGKKYGVAKEAIVVPVKVFDDDGKGSWSQVISGIHWAVQDANQRNSTAHSVMNLSVGGRHFEPINQAITNAVAAGLTVVVAAGNQHQNAADFSPASTPDAITVGAIDDQDQRWGNYGNVIDVFAPGVNILSAGNAHDTAEAWMVGTSQACPHVTGIIAYWIQLFGPSNPYVHRARLLEWATTVDKIDDLGSPPFVLFNGARQYY